MKGKSLLTLEEFSAAEVGRLIALAAELKADKSARRFPERLAHRNIALIFLKPSCRTRTSFVVAAADEGANLQVFPKEDIRFGIKESIRDIARVIGRIFDGIALRADQEVVEEFARHSGIPVWNALSEDHHPTQVLADLLTVQEEFGRIAGVTATEDIAAGVRGADVVYGDIWVSMGQEQNTAELVRALGPYRITRDVMNATGNPRAIFMHCLPALHDDATEFARQFPGVCDVADDVFEGEQSRVFDQSENRMHTIKALMVAPING
jgi:ornithine carbamoyltransferase